MKDRGVRSCGDEKCEIKWGGREVGLGSKGFFVARERKTTKGGVRKGFRDGCTGEQLCLTATRTCERPEDECVCKHKWYARHKGISPAKDMISCTRVEIYGKDSGVDADAMAQDKYRSQDMHEKAGNGGNDDHATGIEMRKR